MNVKIDLYNKICGVLTSYEEYPFNHTNESGDWVEQFYILLTEIQNNWEYITAQE